MQFAGYSQVFLSIINILASSISQPAIYYCEQLALY